MVQGIVIDQPWFDGFLRKIAVQSEANGEDRRRIRRWNLMQEIKNLFTEIPCWLGAEGKPGNEQDKNGHDQAIGSWQCHVMSAKIAEGYIRNDLDLGERW